MTDPLCSRLETCQATDAALQVILRTIPVPLAVTRVADGTILFANDLVRSTFGFPSSGRIDLKSAELYCDPEDRHRLLEALERDRVVTACEVRVRKADGTPRWVALSAEYLTYGGETAIFAAFHDITERKQQSDDLELRVRQRTEALQQTNAELRAMHAAIEEREESFRVIAEATPIAMSIVRQSDRALLWANDRFGEMLGLRIQEWFGRQLPDVLFDQNDREMLLQVLEEQGILTNYELRLRKPSGTQLYARVNVRHITYRGELAFFSAFGDITEYKTTEARIKQEVKDRTTELERANDRFRTIIEFIPVPIAIARKSNGKVMYANDHFAAMYGLTRGSEILGRDMTEFFVDPADRAVMVHSLEDRGYLNDRELRYKKVDGTLIWVAAHFRYLHYDGEPAIFGALVDITERKQYSERLQRDVEKRTAELEAARDGALAANQAKNEFLANVSHELRNPLNHINGYCELLEQAALQHGHDYLLADLREARASANSLRKLVDDILELTRMGAHNVRLDPREFAVDEFIHKLAASMIEDLQRNGNRLEVSCAAGVGIMHTDRDRLRQILTNLLSNAGKFTDHGTITLRVERQTRRSEDWLEFTVTDTGIGMTADEVKRLFMPFQQANADIGRKYGGTGLGLALSQGYCKAMGGNITVTAEPGKGSQFTVHLPAIIAPRAAPLTLQGPPIPSAGNLVLVIDDDPKVHQLMNRFVGTRGFRIQSAHSGLEGLKLARELRPAAITLDTLMPDLSGWEVLRLLKDAPETADIPVIMVTVVDDQTRGFELGASEFVTKPVEWSHVAAILEKYCTVVPGAGFVPPIDLGRRPDAASAEPPVAPRKPRQAPAVRSRASKATKPAAAKKSPTPKVPRKKKKTKG